ncbi:MAG: Gldg family protein, partial [Deltaproteobacteria bacterium]|nr:Gldg family protein [Deltaproteobacteria bacterium]
MRVPGAIRAAYWVWRRELHIMMRAPILYVVGGVFLVVQGVAFAGLVGALSDPRKPAPLGALLEGQLAGTLLTWVLSLVVLTLLGMRAIAEDKRSGAWELLLTAQVGEGAAVVGKWLAAVTLYAALWIPTLAYLAVVAVYRADDGGWDGAAIACGYLGAIAIGAALLAWAIAASAAMSSTLGAGALGFALLMGIFLVGELSSLWPDLALDHPRIAAIFEAVSVRGTALAFARGELAAAGVIFVGGLAAVGLSLAITLACAERRGPREVRTRTLGTVALAAIALAAGTLAIRHPMRLDVSADRRNTLDPATVGVLAGLSGTATLTIVRPTLGGLDVIYDEVARVVNRMSEIAPGLAIRWVDPAAAPGGLAAVARAAGLAPEDLASGGAVVVEHAGRRRVIDLFAFAKVDAGPGGAPTIERLAIEQALTGALAALALARPITVCASTGQGELPLAARDDKADWSLIAERLKGEGMTLEDVAITTDVPRRCTVLVIAGAATAFTPEQALALQAFVQAGGAIVIAAATRTLSGGAGGAGMTGTTGLDGFLATEGLGLPAAIALDPALAVREIPGALFVIDGYVAHPINAGFAKTRATLWFQPRPVLVHPGAAALIRASSESWGETDLQTSPPAKQESDLAGPIVLAAVGRSGKVIVTGSAESLSTAVLAGGPSAGDLWLARAIRWLAGLTDPVVAARTPDQVRLVLTPGERRAVISLSVAGIPLAWALLGG